MIGAPGTKNAFIIKSPMTTTIPTSQQSHPIIKGNVIPSRNITVRKVMNVLPPGAKQIIATSTSTLPTTVQSTGMNIIAMPATVQPAIQAATPQTAPSPVKTPVQSPAKPPAQQIDRPSPQ